MSHVAAFLILAALLGLALYGIGYKFKWRDLALVVLLAVLIFLAGCAVTGSKTATVACQAADAYTTVRVLDEGGVEKNPFLPQSKGGIILVKFVITALLLAFHDDISKEAHTAINAITCGVAVHNTRVLREQKRINQGN